MCANQWTKFSFKLSVQIQPTQNLTLWLFIILNTVCYNYLLKVDEIDEEMNVLNFVHQTMYLICISYATNTGTLLVLKVKILFLYSSHQYYVFCLSDIWARKGKCMYLL